MSATLNMRRIEQEMQRLGLSKNRLAKECNRSRGWPQRVWKERSATLDSVSRIAKVLGVTPKDLII